MKYVAKAPIKFAILFGPYENSLALGQFKAYIRQSITKNFVWIFHLLMLCRVNVVF